MRKPSLVKMDVIAKRLEAMVTQRKRSRIITLVYPACEALGFHEKFLAFCGDVPAELLEKLDGCPTTIDDLLAPTEQALAIIEAFEKEAFQ